MKHDEIVETKRKDVEKLIQQLFKKKEEKDWILEEVLHGGPPHKQLLSSMLLADLSKLIFSKQKESGKKFELEKGYAVNVENESETYPIPVDHLGKKNDEMAVKTAEFIAKAPDHESIVYLITLQALKWLRNA